MPDEPSQYIPPWRLPAEASEIQIPEVVQQTPQENNQAPQDPKGQLSSFEEIAVSFLVFFLFYWIVYLFFNFNSRTFFGLGFSDFPLPPTLGSGGLGSLLPKLVWVPDLTQVFLLPFEFAAALFIYIAYRRLRINKPRIAKLVLFIPAAIFVLSIITAIILSNYFACEGFGCMAFVAIVGGVLIFAISAYVAILLSNVFLSLVKRFRSIFAVLIVLSVIALIIPFFIPMFFIKSFEDRVVIDNEVKITKTSFKKEEISKKEYDKVKRVKRNFCCSILEKRLSGEVVLKN